jgi:hypothetical protein
VRERVSSNERAARRVSKKFLEGSFFEMWGFYKFRSWRLARKHKMLDVACFLNPNLAKDPGSSGMSGEYITSLTSMSECQPAHANPHPIVSVHVFSTQSRRAEAAGRGECICELHYRMCGVVWIQTPYIVNSKKKPRGYKT